MARALEATHACKQRGKCLKQCHMRCASKSPRVSVAYAKQPQSTREEKEAHERDKKETGVSGALSFAASATVAVSAVLLPDGAYLVAPDASVGTARAAEERVLGNREQNAANEALQEIAGLEPNPSTNARSILRNALPIDNKPIREVQANLEQINEDLRIPGVNIGGVQKACNKSMKVMAKNRRAIEDAIVDENVRPEVDKLDSGLQELKSIADNNDKQRIPVKQQELLAYVGDIEEGMVKEFPFTVPQEFNSLPQLKGRATVDATVRIKDNPDISSGTMRIVLDGYNAPVTAGNFVDLVQRKFYDGLPVQRSDGFVVQTGDPEGPADGFVDPATNETRRIPFEVKVRGDKEPTYYETLEEQGRARAQPVLPFNAFGTLAMARSEFETNSASSQIFWLLKEAELTPSGANILDGRYAVFGYLVDGQGILNELKVGDVFESMKVIDGAQNLVNSSLNKATVQSNGSQQQQQQQQPEQAQEEQSQQSQQQ